MRQKNDYAAEFYRIACLGVISVVVELTELRQRLFVIAVYGLGVFDRSYIKEIRSKETWGNRCDKYTEGSEFLGNRLTESLNGELARSIGCCAEDTFVT